MNRKQTKNKLLWASLIGSILIFNLVKVTFGFQDQNFGIYTDKFDEYSISYPSDWFVQTAKVPGSVVAISNYDPTILTSTSNFDPNKFSVDLIVLSNPRNPQKLSLEQFILWHDRNNYEGTGIETIVHSVNPIVVNGKNGILREITTIATVWEALIDADDRIYLLAGRKDSEFENEFSQILYSLKLKDSR